MDSVLARFFGHGGGGITYSRSWDVSILRTPFSEKGPQAFFELDEVRAQGSVE